ncbi:MAG TPA: protein kinase [Candidatus Sulfotelmatobacter sp.]|nr:protein kinase [Candidatus Sulfotelmatobacter sp.]
MPSSLIAGRYELQGQLGEGGMGVVWRALDVKTGGSVAIKLMKDMSDPVAVDLFTKEWRALAEISHPNIVEVRDVDVIEENGQKKPFFVMPLLRGTTLADLIADASARLTVERVVEIAVHVCRGLQAAHQRGLIHRDLKPSNILVMEDDSAKIIDFGVVHLAGSKSVTGQKGTFQYMSPEQAMMREITPASDLFSMGIILYEALTRRKPFARNTVQDTMDALLKFVPPAVSELNPNVNMSLSRVVHKCLAKQPIHRFASARDLADVLQKAVRNEPVFDTAKIEQRIERAKAAYKSGDEGFASEILAELEAEGHLDPRITVLRMQIEMAAKAKKTRQLLESARARMEQDEIPLALDKIREVLELDPDNPDALAMRHAMEKQRNEGQIARWLELAQTHLSNRDFGAARNAAKEVLAINRADGRAMDLLEKIESTETDAKRIREQKEQLYTLALKAYQNGEISTALSKLERLFSVAQSNPNAAIPEREAVYQSFYKEVRSERDTIHGALEDAQRQFREKNFAGAMAVCRELLAKYPNDGTFHALKIQIEDAERQELSSYMADVSQRLEAERDLDTRVNIARDACERYPNEAQFAQQLKLVRERRDLVNSIVVKARQYDERGQFAEAISQWDILRNIHPDYPGITFEIKQCKKKRDQQGRDEERSRLVNEIDGLMKSRAYAKAIEYASSALQEFPADTEISGLRTLAQQGMERTKESRRLFEEGQRCVTQGDLLRGTELLRSSLNLDPRAPGLRDAVVNVLIERARACGEDNWQDAEPLCQEASELDANNPAVRALRSSLTDAKRKAFVVQCLTECRSLVAAGKVNEATQRVRAARQMYPNDGRLEQYAASLEREMNELLRQEQRRKDQTALSENRRLAEQNPDRANLRSVLEKSYAIRAHHPDDPEIARTVSEIELAVKNVARVEDVKQVLSVEPSLTGTNGWRATMVQQAPGQQAPRSADKKGPQLVDKTATATNTARPGARPKSGFHTFTLELEALAQRVQGRLLALARPGGQWSGVRLGTAGAVVILLPLLAYFAFHLPSNSKKSAGTPTTATVTIATDPPDSLVTSEGKAVANGGVAIGTTIEVSHIGYKTRQVQIQQDSDGKVSLEPEPLHLSVHASGTAGSAEIDGQKVADLTDGSLEYALSPDGTLHKLTVTADNKQLLTVYVQASPGQQPRVTGFDANNLLAITSLGNQATLYGASNLGSAQVGDQSAAINPTGAPITLTDQNHDVVFGKGDDQGSASIDISNAPALMVQSLSGAGRIFITTNADKAILSVDGSPMPRQNRGWTVSKAPGPHKFTLSAEGFEPQSWTMAIQRRGVVNKNVNLHAKAAAVQPLTAGLSIVGGTPGADVTLDGKNVGELDLAGSLNLPNAVAPGKHKVGLTKPGYEAREFEITISPSAPGKPLADAQISKPVLSSSTAGLAFDVTTKGATVKFRRVGDAQFRDVNPSEKIQLPPGQYEIVAEAAGYQRFTTTVNLGKEEVTVPVNLGAVPDYEFEDAHQVSHEGAWLKSKVPGKFINLKPGLLRENIVFSRPGKTLFWDKKVEWMIEDPAHHSRVQYSLEGGKLTRRLVVGQDTSYQKEAKVDAQSAGQKDSLSLHIRVDAGQVRITNDRGTVLDEFAAPGQDFSNGRIAIRSDSLFVVRTNNQ